MLVYVYQIVLYRRAESGEIFHAEDTGITTTTDISGSMLISPMIVTVLLYPLPHLHGVCLGLFSTCRSSVQLGLSSLRKVRSSRIDFVQLCSGFMSPVQIHSQWQLVSVAETERAECVKGHPRFLGPFLQTLRSFQTAIGALSQVSPQVLCYGCAFLDFSMMQLAHFLSLFFIVFNGLGL